MKALVLALLAIFVMTGQAAAHPGRTASDGCHYCRTNCDSWGVPWNARHCHGGLKEEPSIRDILDVRSDDHGQVDAPALASPVEVNHSPVEGHVHPHLSDS